jgi:hypothetical protein
MKTVTSIFTLVPIQVKALHGRLSILLNKSRRRRKGRAVRFISATGKEVLQVRYGSRGPEQGACKLIELFVAKFASRSRDRQRREAFAGGIKDGGRQTPHLEFFLFVVEGESLLLDFS